MYNSETNSEHYQGCNVSTYCDTYNGGGEDTKSNKFSVEIPLIKTTDDGSYYLLNSLSIVFSNSSLVNCKCDSVFANSSVTVNVKTDNGKEIATNKANINMFEVSLEDADSVIVSGSVWATSFGYCHHHDYSFARASADISGVTANYIKLSI